MACLCCGVCFFSEYLSTIFITTSDVVMERQSVADLIKKLSNNVKNSFEVQAPIWSDEVSWLTELSLQKATSAQCVCIGVLLLCGVVFCRICQLLPSCDVAWPNERKNKHLSISNRSRISCGCSFSHTEVWWVKVGLAKPWCLALHMWSSLIVYFPASRNAVLWMRPAQETTLPSYYQTVFVTNWKLFTWESGKK